MNNDKPLYEDQYKSIVIDRDNDDFRILKGDFKDKKDVITTYDDDYVIKRVYEKDVFDWISKNAKDAIDAYLLYSIAFRKWKNNNLLKHYYEKLINDIPRLKDPEMIHTRDTRTKESVTQNREEDMTDTKNIIENALTEFFNKPTITSGKDLEGLDVDLNAPVNNVYKLFVKGMTGKKDEIEVLAPESEELGYPKEVEAAAKELRTKYPNEKFIYIQVNDQEPEKYIEMWDEAIEDLL